MGEGSPSIRATYTASADDLARAYQRHNREALRSLKSLIALVVTLVLVGVALAAAMPREPVAVTVILAAAAACGLLGPLAMIRWRVPAAARRIYDQQRDLQQPMTVIADAKVLMTESETGESRTPWSHYVRSVEDDHVILLYRSDVLFQFIPKRALDEVQIETLRSFATAAGLQAAARRSG